MATQLAPTGGKASPIATKAMAKKDIVVIDDDPTFCQTMLYCAKRRGLELDYFTSLMEMGSIASFRKYSVAIIDYQLEQMSGLEVAEYFPAFFNEIPVILISQNDHKSGECGTKWPVSIKQFVGKNQGSDRILDAALAWRTIGMNEKGQHTDGTTPHLDPTVMQELVELDAEGDNFITQLYQAFISTSVKTIEDLHTAFASLDFIGMSHRAHKLKGSARNVGAMILAEHCGRLEVHANHRNLSVSYTLLKDIETEWKAVVESLKNSPHLALA